MKNLLFLMSMVLGMAVVFSAVSCNEDVLTQPGSEDVTGPVNEQVAVSGLSGINQEKLALLPVPQPSMISARNPISYVGELYGTGSVTKTHDYKNSIGYPDLWDYFSFYGVAGQVISIDGDRVSCGMDLAFTLYYGMTDDNAGVTYYSGIPSMQWISFHDDEDPAFCEPGCFAFFDPRLTNYVLPYTGYYTIAAFDYISGECTEAPYTYTLYYTNLGLDTDGDGVYDLEDNCVDIQNPDQANCDGDAYGDVCDPDDDNDGVMDEIDVVDCSNMDETINLEGCDSGVANAVFEDGMTMMDAIHVCAANAGNHGDFVSCVALLTNQWKKAGLITGYDKELIMDCVAAANIP